MLQALKGGETVGLLPDQVPPEGMGVMGTVFGRQAYTMTMAAKLVAQTRCAVVLLRGERLGPLARWRLGCDYIVHASRVSPDVEQVLAGGDAAQSAAAVNRLMEDLIMQAPRAVFVGLQPLQGPRAEILTSADANPELVHEVRFEQFGRATRFGHLWLLQWLPLPVLARLGAALGKVLYQWPAHAVALPCATSSCVSAENRRRTRGHCP